MKVNTDLAGSGKSLLPFKIVIEGKKFIFFYERLYSTRVGHLYDVCNKVDVSLYKFKDINNTFHGKIVPCTADEIEKLCASGDAEPLFIRKEFIIPTDNINTISFKPYYRLTDLDVYNFIREQIEEYVGKEEWLYL